LRHEIGAAVIAKRQFAREKLSGRAVPSVRSVRAVRPCHAVPSVRAVGNDKQNQQLKKHNTKPTHMLSDCVKFRVFLSFDIIRSCIGIVFVVRCLFVFLGFVLVGLFCTGVLL
jgi:hypothetical protein